MSTLLETDLEGAFRDVPVVEEQSYVLNHSNQWVGNPAFSVSANLTSAMHSGSTTSSTEGGEGASGERQLIPPPFSQPLVRGPGSSVVHEPDVALPSPSVQVGVSQVPFGYAQSSFSTPIGTLPVSRDVFGLRPPLVAHEQAGPSGPSPAAYVGEGFRAEYNTFWGYVTSSSLKYVTQCQKGV